jgi:O-antigen ligase
MGQNRQRDLGGLQGVDRSGVRMPRSLAHALAAPTIESKPGVFLVPILLVSSALVGLFAVKVGAVPLLLLASIPLVLLLLVTKWPTFAIVYLMAASAVNRYTVEVYGLSVKAEHIVVPLIGAMIVARVAVLKDRKPALDIPGRLIIVYVALNLLSSALNDPEYSLRLAGLVSLVGLSYLVATNLVLDRPFLERAYNTFVLLTVFQAAFGIMCIVVYDTMKVNLGVQTSYHVGMGAIQSPYGTFWESNIFGQYCMIGALLLLTRLGYERDRLVAAKLVCGLFIAVVGLLLSLTRGAWLGFLGGVFILVIWQIRNRRGFRFGKPLIFLLGAGIAIAVLGAILRGSMGVGALVAARLATFHDILRDPTVESRLFNYGVALRFWMRRPLLGWGSGGFTPVFEAVSPIGTPWVGNWAIHALFDTGTIGLCVIVAIFGKLVFDAFRNVRAARDRVLERILLSLSVSFCGYLIASLATGATWLAFSWIHMGLLAAATRIVRDACTMLMDGDY